jgi:hypothetical protein
MKGGFPWIHRAALMPAIKPKPPGLFIARGPTDLPGPIKAIVFLDFEGGIKLEGFDGIVFNLIGVF